DRQRLLEDTVEVIRRLVHDFGNVLTGVLGFSELTLTQLDRESPIHLYLTEVYETAQRGTQWIQQLRQFTRRAAPARLDKCLLQVVLPGEERRLREACGSARLQLDVPPDLPALTLELEPLRQIVGCLLDNARDALSGEGLITLSARPTDLTP